MTRLARLSLRFRTVTLLIVAMLVGAGAYSVGQLNQELFPSIEIPNLIVTATLPGAGPNAVADDVATPIEAALLSTSSLEHVQSTSLEGLTIVSASYEFGTDMDAVLTDAREKVAALNLPEGSEVQIQRISLDAFPVFSVAVSGADEAALEDYVTTTLSPAIGRLSEVADVRVAGGSNFVISVVLDPVLMDEAGISTGNVAAALQSAELSVPVGSVASGGFQLPVRVVAATDGVEAVENLLIAGSVPGSSPVTLSEIASVSLTEDGAGSTISRLDGQPAMSVEVIKAQGENTVETVAAVQEAIAGLPGAAGVTITEVINQAPEIQNSVSELTRDAVIGGVLAVLMILIFLRSFRGTLVSGVSIPLSLLVAFILMRVDNITLNILTLGALSVATGRVIDDAIVVLENIHRLLDNGYERAEAVIKGTTQMVPAITASTITTVAVFLPLAFIGGLVGQVFVGFALTVTFALLASLIVAVTVVPVLAITFLKRSHRPAGSDRRVGSGRHRPAPRLSQAAGLGPASPLADDRTGPVPTGRVRGLIGDRPGHSLPDRRGEHDRHRPHWGAGYQPGGHVGPGRCGRSRTLRPRRRRASLHRRRHRYGQSPRCPHGWRRRWLQQRLHHPRPRGGRRRRLARQHDRGPHPRLGVGWIGRRAER